MGVAQKLFTLLLLLLTAGTAIAKPKPRQVEAVSVYYLPLTQSILEGKIEAERRARIEALADEFGTVFGMQTTTVITSEAAKVNTLGLSEVRGQWMRDIEPPTQTMTWDDDAATVAITTRVKGLATEIPPSTTDLRVSVMANGRRTNTFADGEALTVGFRSGRDGYVAIFLIDDNGQTQTLLPYVRAAHQGSVAVSRDRDYAFFSPADAPAELRPVTDRYRLRCTNGEAERNRLCVVFSPNPFVGSGSESSASMRMPRSQSFADFDRWLFTLRTSDPATGVIFNDITVNANE